MNEEKKELASFTNIKQKREKKKIIKASKEDLTNNK